MVPKDSLAPRSPVGPGAASGEEATAGAPGRDDSGLEGSNTPAGSSSGGFFDNLINACVIQ